MKDFHNGNPEAPDYSEQLDAIFRAFPDLLLSVNTEGLILDHRSGVLSSFSFTSPLVEGRPIQEFFPNEVSEKIMAALNETFKTSKMITCQYSAKRLDQQRWYEAHIVPLDGSRAVIIIRDVSEKTRSTERIQSQLRRLAALNAADTAIASSFDLNVTLSVILRQLINTLGIDAADILTINPDTHMLEYVVGQGLPAKKPQPVSVMIGQGYAGKAVLERRTISVRDYESQPLNAFYTSNHALEKFANYCAVPLISKGEVKGVLEIYQRSFSAPDDDWLDFLATIAGQAAVAIDNSSLFHELQRTNAELSHAYDAAIESWAQVLELSNREPSTHASRVVDLTLRLAHAMGVEEANLIHYRRGALLHDVGKLGIPENILNKKEPLSEAERKILENHAILAYQLLSPINYLAAALDIPHYHHEHWDGSGYPDGLRGELIPFSARLFAVVDVYDALTSIRPYRSAWSQANAFEYIEHNSGILFDPMVVKNFLRIMR